MGYDRLGEPEPGSSQTEPITNQQEEPTSAPPTTRSRNLQHLLIIVFASLIVVSVASVVIIMGLRTSVLGKPELKVPRKPTQAISRACSKTRYPTLCVNSLLEFPGTLTADESQLVHISVNVTLQRFAKALNVVSEIDNVRMDPTARMAYEDCLELMEDSVDLLTRSLSSIAPSNNRDPKGRHVGSTQDVRTWLSAALTNQDTCRDGFEHLRGHVKGQMEERVRDLSELVSNCLAIYAASSDPEDFAGAPVQNRRRLMAEYDGSSERSEFPEWMSRRERVLLESPASAIQADIVVSKEDGNGMYKTITEAIKKVPEYSKRRVIIQVRAGRYEENNLKVGRKKTNVMIIGEGKGKTIISGGNSVFDNMTTFHTASFAATGAGFIARDITFVNWAGPSKHQAVALRVGADHSVVYRCNIIGYQDTLYVHSQRQFFRECDIYGTIDFIFGNAAVVFQSCNIYARKPNPRQRNTITAQNRKDPNQNTGISIHACRILATPDLQASKGSVETYLGRPWKLYSRTVYMLSYVGDHIDPRGWLEWNATVAVDKLYYGEYMNYGPGGAVGQRVKWPGYRVITSSVEASKFTVAKFIYGSSWLPATGVAFFAGLSA